MGDKSLKLSVIVEKDRFGYHAFCPMLDGCHTQGRTLEEVLYNIREAIELYWDTLSEEEKRDLLSKEVRVLDMEVEVA